MPKRSKTPKASPMVKKPTIMNSYDIAATEVWVKCGECANTLGLNEAAIKSFENAVNRDPSNIAALCGLSLSLRLNDINNNETFGSQSSIERLNSSIESFPNLLKDSNIFKELSECYLLIGLNDQAHQAIQSAISLSPQDASLWLLSAQTLIRVGARAHAANSLTHCLSLLPQNGKYSQQDIETARAAHAELAAIAAADGNIETSIAELSSTLSLPPPPLSRIDEHIALWCALSTAKERANDIIGAIKACEDAEVAVGDSPRIIMTRAYLLLLLNPKENSDLAISLLNKIINLDDENTINEGTDFLPWYLLGRAYSLTDRPRLAYDSYQVALRCASNSPITWLAVGKLYLELKQLPDALAAYSQALKLQIEDGSQGTATAWDGLSCVYERCDDHLMDASDACGRAGLCFKAIGDLKNSNYFEIRSEQLAKAAKNEGPIPELRQPPDVPSFLLRDLVALAPNERIAYTQTQRTQHVKQEQQQQQAQQQQQQQQTPSLQQQQHQIHQPPPQPHQQQQQPIHQPQHYPPQYQQSPQQVQHIPHQQQPPSSQQQTPSQPPYRGAPTNQQPQPQQAQYYYPPSQQQQQQQQQPNQQYYYPPPPQHQQQSQPPPQHQHQQSPPQHSHPQMIPNIQQQQQQQQQGPPVPPPAPYSIAGAAPGSLPPPAGPYGQYLPIPGGVVHNGPSQYSSPNSWRR
ncbi:hypothetical protein KGF54_003680 [Candida jiufengensis]|uniref:uncharacterized protein n=1 Tax=Candida jiufengensis TaxID=497108 RepID=UPI0022245A9A|nr:uncharacterized protein KGF54_003680 [Candida jiufengensis]KAI5952813.1 hypothetical protein KGF54_003680 [Candida jiufengensis]